jgi:hypothetical protein
MKIKASTTSACPADIKGDEVVNVLDFLALLVTPGGRAPEASNRRVNT